MDINTNTPYTVNQVANTKPNVPKSDNLLVGFVAGSMNGGMNHTITYKKVMAGERHKEYKQQLKISTLTPLTPTYQNLTCTLRAYYVPNTRVWENAEKYTAQKGGSAENKITEIPNIGGKELWKAMLDDDSGYVMSTQTTAWRDSFISSYIPRIGEFETDGIQIIMPPISALPLRGRIAIYNDFERNKEYEPAAMEFNGDTVTDFEWQTYNPLDLRYKYINQMRAKRGNSYYSDYRTDIQGFEESYPPADMSSDKALITWASWEHKIAEARSQAENAQRNDWDIIAEIRGSAIATQGKVQLIGKRTFNLNYAAVTQNAYNNGTEDITFKVLGKQGAYSFTEVEVPLYAGMEFIEEGYVHIIATVSAETVFEKGIDRNLINVKALDEYRPDMLNEKQDVLYAMECGYGITNHTINNFDEVIGFKRKYSEYFKLPNIIQGDMTNDNYYETFIDTNHNGYIDYDKGMEVITQKTYQFFEKDMFALELSNGDYVPKEIWKDYTDILLNRNQAIMNATSYYYDDENERHLVEVNGQNQIFYVGKSYCQAILPIDESIKSNYTEWGEH